MTIQGKSNNGNLPQKWCSALVWCLSQVAAFTSTEFLQANPGFAKHDNCKHLNMFEKMGYIISIPVAKKPKLWMPRPVWAFCGHGMKKSACPLCGSEQAEKLAKIPSDGII